jgi:hypothetical protein
MEIHNYLHMPVDAWAHDHSSACKNRARDSDNSLEIARCGALEFRRWADREMCGLPHQFQAHAGMLDISF